MNTQISMSPVASRPRKMPNPKPANPILSEGRQVAYLCPECAGIVERKRMFGEDSYVCRACKKFGPWAKRMRLPWPLRLRA